MSLVTVKNKYQIVIPQGLREALNINRGDLLEVRVERGKLTYTPKTVLDRIPAKRAQRQQFFQQLREEAPAWLQDIWTSSRRRGTDKLTMRQINRIIEKARKGQAAKKIKQPTR